MAVKRDSAATCGASTDKTAPLRGLSSLPLREREGYSERIYMKDTFESPDANEQVKPTTTRSRATARSKSDTQNSQEQAARPTVQRRTTSSTSAASTAEAPSTTRSRSTTGTGRGVSLPPPSAPAARPTSTQRPAAHPQGAPLQAPAQRYSGTAPVQRSASPGGTQVQRPGTPSSRPSSASPGTARPAGQGYQGHPAPARPGTQGRPGTARPAGASRPATPAQRPQERRTAAVKEKPTGPVSIPPQIVVKDLATLLHATPNEIIRDLIKNGIFASINQVVDYEKAAVVAKELGFEPQASALTVAPAVQREKGLSANEAMMATRNEDDMVVIPPVVTIMGHVDHGKTSLLDTIRKTKVAVGEAGGITQHIGAYQVEVHGKKITFLDTPGHEAFTAMRARGAQVTDIVVLVVAADDAIMPQTIEAISHAKNAGVPLVVAINKIDLPSANVQKVKQDLLAHGVVLEEFGGATLATPISAKTGKNVQELLDQILLQAELLDLKANPDRRAQGTVLEATLDPGKGPLATILVQNGTLHVGDDFICGQFYGRVRAMYDERGQTVDAAGPSTPVQVLGFEGVPEAGDTFQVMTDAAAARDIAQKRQRLEREAQHRRSGRVKTLEDFMAERAEGGAAALRLIIKADQGGPAEALADALAQLSTSEVKVEVVHRGVGAITESDVLLAKASGAIIVGFHVRPDSNARAAADRERVEIRTYRIIYEAVEEVKLAMEGLLAPEKKEIVLGEAEVRQIFKIAKIGTIAGCFVRSGVIPRTGRVRVIRNGVEVYDGTLASLKRFKDDVREVREGFECGIGIENFNDVKVSDLIESYRIEEVARSLSAAES